MIKIQNNNNKYSNKIILIIKGYYLARYLIKILTVICITNIAKSQKAKILVI